MGQRAEACGFSRWQPLSLEGRGSSNTQEGRKYQQRNKQADEHAATRDDTELCHTSITGGDKAEKTDGRRDGPNFERSSNVANGLLKRAFVIALRLGEFAVPEAKVNGIVRPDTDVHHRKGDRNEIELTECEGRKCGRKNEP